MNHSVESIQSNGITKRFKKARNVLHNDRSVRSLATKYKKRAAFPIKTLAIFKSLLIYLLKCVILSFLFNKIQPLQRMQASFPAPVPLLLGSTVVQRKITSFRDYLGSLNCRINLVKASAYGNGAQGSEEVPGKVRNLLFL